MSRQCKGGFLQTYLDYTIDSESPELFHLWSAISIVSAALGRKCYVHRGHFMCYPNQYIVLVSESARCRKTSAADIAVKLFRKSKVGDIYKGNITMRALSKKLHGFRETTGTSSCFIYSPELGKLFGADSYVSGLMTFFTDFYDCPDIDTYETATQGTDIFEDVFLHLLGCTIPRWLAGMPSDMVEGGFSSRTLFIVQNVPKKPNAFPTITKSQLVLEAALIHDLEEIAKLKGGFKLTEQAKVYYESWYIREYRSIDEKDIRLRAYYGRKGEHVLKVAMCINAGRTSSMVIDHLDIDASLKLLTQVEKYMPGAFREVSFSASTRYTDTIIQQIKNNGGAIRHSDLLKKNHHHMDKDEMKKIVDTLIEANILRLEITKGGARKYVIIGGV